MNTESFNYPWASREVFPCTSLEPGDMATTWGTKKGHHTPREEGEGKGKGKYLVDM